MAHPQHPLYWSLVTQSGHEVQMVRLLHFNWLPLLQEAVAEGTTQREALYQISRAWIELHGYVQKSTSIQRVDWDTETQEVWISVPHPDSPYGTPSRRWNTILRRWPQFIDADWRQDQEG